MMRRLSEKALIPAVFALAACSSGPSQADWVVAADSACDRANIAIAKLPPPGNSLPAMVDYSSGVKEVLQRQQRSLADLDSPESNDASKALNNYVATQLELVDQILVAAKASNAETVQVLFEQSAQELSTSGPALTRAYGFKVCGSPADQQGVSTTTSSP